MLLLFIIISLWVKDSSADHSFINESIPHDKNDHERGEVPEDVDEALRNNQTSCEEFLVNSTFDPLKVIDIDWKIWYFWSDRYEASYNLKFSIPSKVLRDRFRIELDEEIKPPVAWEDAVLFMETTIDFSALFIKTETDGLFSAVPSLAFEYNNMRTALFAMKIIQPEGYLAIENCKYRICYALAPMDKMPHYSKLEEEAKKINFHSSLGRSLLDMPPDDPLPQSHGHDIADDDEEDMQTEVFSHYNYHLESTLL